MRGCSTDLPGRGPARRRRLLRAHPLLRIAWPGIRDAFGIPNRWFTASGALTGGRHKFDDYYSAFDLHQDPVRLPGLDLEAAFDGYARPRIETIKRELLESFPFR